MNSREAKCIMDLLKQQQVSCIQKQQTAQFTALKVWHIKDLTSQTGGGKMILTNGPLERNPVVGCRRISVFINRYLSDGKQQATLYINSDGSMWEASWLTGKDSHLVGNTFGPVLLNQRRGVRRQLGERTSSLFSRMIDINKMISPEGIRG